MPRTEPLPREQNSHAVKETDALLFTHTCRTRLPAAIQCRSVRILLERIPRAQASGIALLAQKVALTKPDRS